MQTTTRSLALEDLIKWVAQLPRACRSAANASGGWVRGLSDSRLSSVSASVLADLAWADCAPQIAAVFRLKGYKVLPLGGDGAADLVLLRGRESFVVHAQQWHSATVDEAALQPVYAAMAAKGAVGGFVLCTGRFSAEAQRYAQDRNLVLVDGERLQVMLRLAPPAVQPGASKPH